MNMYIVQTEENFIRETCPREDGAEKVRTVFGRALYEQDDHGPNSRPGPPTAVFP